MFHVFLSEYVRLFVFFKQTYSTISKRSILFTYLKVRWWFVPMLSIFGLFIYNFSRKSNVCLFVRSNFSRNDFFLFVLDLKNCPFLRQLPNPSWSICTHIHTLTLFSLSTSLSSSSSFYLFLSLSLSVSLSLSTSISFSLSHTYTTEQLHWTKTLERKKKLRKEKTEENERVFFQPNCKSHVCEIGNFFWNKVIREGRKKSSKRFDSSFTKKLLFLLLLGLHEPKIRRRKNIPEILGYTVREPGLWNQEKEVRVRIPRFRNQGNKTSIRNHGKLAH